MKICNDCIYFKRDACSIKGDCFKPLISPTQPACSYFEEKGKPDLEENSPTMSRGMMGTMALDMARNTLYDMADWKAKGLPRYKYPHVEKALRMWLEELGVVIWE